MTKQVIKPTEQVQPEEIKFHCGCMTYNGKEAIAKIRREAKNGPIELIQILLDRISQYHEEY